MTHSCIDGVGRGPSLSVRNRGGRMVDEAPRVTAGEMVYGTVYGA